MPAHGWRDHFSSILGSSKRRDSTMIPQLWIGFGFLLVLVIFLMITYLRRDTSTANQHNILRFLTALCGGFAGGFLTGDALFRFEEQWSSGAKMGDSGRAGG